METSELRPRLLSIRQLFQDPDGTYLVPIYQRNYAWQAQQIEQLLGDIQDALQDGKNSYFLGNLMVTRRKKPFPSFEVIDGQQRLTTLYLLLSFLAQRTGCNSGHHERLRYESRPRASEALRRVASESPRLSGSPASSSTPEDSGIHQGYNVIQQFMSQRFEASDELRRFADFLHDRVTVVRAALPPQTDLNRYFEIMNTRGQQLQQVDIVKARLMQHLDYAAQRACFAWIWEACADMDSYVQMSLTHGKPALRDKIFSSDWSRLTVASFDALVAQHTPADAGQPGASLSLEAALEKYAQMRAPAAGEDQDNERFRSTIEFPAFLLHVLKVMNGDDSEDEGGLDDKELVKRFEHFLENPGAEKSRRVQDFAFKLLRCRNLFDAFILKRQYLARNSDEGDWSLQRLIKRSSNDGANSGYVSTFSRYSQAEQEDGDVDPETDDLLVLQSMLRVTYTSPRTMHWITRLLKLLEGEGGEVTEAELADVLRTYARDKVRAVFPLKNPPAGFSINRIVFTYLDYLLWLEKPKSEFRFTFRNSIEHFYPQHPDEQQSGAQLSKQYLDLLGNLALVSVGVNSKFSNSLPLAKAGNFQRTIEEQSPKLQAMAELTRTRQAWGDKEVYEHHDAMIQLLRRDLGAPGEHAQQQSGTIDRCCYPPAK